MSKTESEPPYSYRSVKAEVYSSAHCSALAGKLLPVPWLAPMDVAQAVVFLASDKARYITGSEFVLDAGLLTR